MGKETLVVRELAQRQSDKLSVTLWWIKDTLDTYVTVEDLKANPPIRHVVDVPDPSLALHRFYHPLANTEEPENRGQLYAVPEGYDGRGTE